MGRKVLLDTDPRMFVIMIIGVSLILTSGCLGLFKKDDNGGDDKILPDHPQIVTAEGMIDDEGNISTVFLDVDLYGDQGVDMRDVVMHLLVTLKDGPAVAIDLIYGSFGQIDSESFGVRELFDPNNTWDPDDTPAHYILGKGCVLELEVNLTASAVPLPPHSTLEVFMYTTTSAHQTYDLFQTPSSYPASGKVSLED